jgi:uncharacterized protein YcbX
VRVAALWRYPVKSLQGEPVPHTIVGTTGVVSDRHWAVRDVASGAVLSAKREPRLLLAAASSAGEGVQVRVPGCGATAGAGADALLSDWLGRPVQLDEARESPYVDEAHLHLLAAGEVGDWDVRRFRANVVVDGVGCLDDLVGERLEIGGVLVEVTKRTKRCAMPTMAQTADVGKDVSVLRELARGRELRLGVYARVVSPGVLAVGAPIEIR